jgi:hypothetical protein
MKRLVFVTLLLTVPLALLAQQSFAAKPTIQRIPIDDTFRTGACGFAVEGHTTGTIVDISYTDAQGNFHEFQAGPQVKSTYTNLLTGKSIIVNISGPGDFTFYENGGVTLVGTGLWSWDGDPDTGAPGLFLTQGRFVQTLDANFNQTSFTRNGTKIDLCAQLN